MLTRGAAAELLTGQGAAAEVLTEELQRRSWPGRCGGADQPGRLCWVSAGRGAVAKIHREDNAGRGAKAKIHREDNARQAAVAGRLLTEAMAESHRE